MSSLQFPAASVFQACVQSSVSFLRSLISRILCAAKLKSKQVSPLNNSGRNQSGELGPLNPCVRLDRDRRLSWDRGVARAEQEARVPWWLSLKLRCPAFSELRSPRRPADVSATTWGAWCVPRDPDLDPTQCSPTLSAVLQQSSPPLASPVTLPLQVPSRPCPIWCCPRRGWKPSWWLPRAWSVATPAARRPPARPPSPTRRPATG